MGAASIDTGLLATGQAAGTAAALAVREGIVPGKLDTSHVQKVLTDQGVDWIVG